jgi:NADPH:quinone reductase-like Zn-dependent oxidoreductase
MFAIQLARRAGYNVIATASPSSFDLVKSYGAHRVVSYRDQDAALIEIKKLTNGGVSAGLDCVGGQKNITFAVNAFGPKGGKLSTTLMGSKSKRKDVELSPLMVFTVLGKVRPCILSSYSAELIIGVYVHTYHRSISSNARKKEMV